MSVVVALHGGGAAKVSNRYEEQWTFLCLLDIVADTATAIQLEPPGTAGVGFEFWLQRAGMRQWHQAKYQNGRLGKWTLSELKSEKVIENFRLKLSGGTHVGCLFVSAHAAFQLSRLCESANIAASFAQFMENFLPSEDVTKAFNELRDNHWRLNGRRNVGLVASDLLPHDRYDHAGQLLSERISVLLAGDRGNALQALREVYEGAFYGTLDRAQLIAELEAKGCYLRDWNVPGTSVETGFANARSTP